MVDCWLWRFVGFNGGGLWVLVDGFFRFLFLFFVFVLFFLILRLMGFDFDYDFSD